MTGGIITTPGRLNASSYSVYYIVPVSGWTRPAGPGTEKREAPQKDSTDMLPFTEKIPITETTISATPSTYGKI